MQSLELFHFLPGYVGGLLTNLKCKGGGDDRFLGTENPVPGLCQTTCIGLNRGGV